MEKLDLEAIRRRIDKIDAQLVAALEERMEAVLEVAAYKKQQGLPVLDAAREAQVLSKACMRLQHKEYASAVESKGYNVMTIQGDTLIINLGASFSQLNNRNLI